MNKRWSYRNLVTYLVLLTVIAVILLPFAWLFSQSLKSRGDMFGYPPRLIPKTVAGDNYLRILKNTAFLKSVANSLIISFCDVVGGLIVCSMAGFAFAKYEFRFKNALFYVVLIAMMIPFHVVVIPLFIEMRWLRLLDTRTAVILPFLAKPFGVFFMRQFLTRLPDELLEAARIDGASEFRIWLQVVVPLSKPAFGVLACLFFVETWNMLLWPIIVLTENQTIQVFLRTLIARYQVDYGALMAGSCLAVLPVLVLFLAMQKQLISGLTAGAVK